MCLRSWIPASKLWLLSLSLPLLTSPLSVQAHQDPLGDTRPEVRVEAGNFVIEFDANNPDESGDEARRSLSMTYRPDGRLLIPRHFVPRRSDDVWTRKAQDQNPAVVQALPMTWPLQKDRQVRVVLSEKPGFKERRQPLPLKIEYRDDYFAFSYATVEQVTIAGPWIGLTWASEPEGGSGRALSKLHFSLVSREGFTPGETVTLGDAGAIYTSPIASAPVWAAGRWWIAWVKRDPALQPWPWRTELSSYDPVTRKLAHKTLPGLSDSNTALSMKTTGGWLCIAWHAVPNEYPGLAQIVTAFEKLPEP